MSDEKGIMDAVVASALGVISYMGYLEMRLRNLSLRREKQSEDIIRLQTETCTTEQVRTIVKDEMSETRKDVKEIFGVVTDIKVCVEGLKR